MNSLTSVGSRVNVNKLTCVGSLVNLFPVFVRSGSIARVTDETSHLHGILATRLALDSTRYVDADLFARLSKRYMCDMDETQAIGRRYRRQDEIGTPLCITVDFETPNDDSVTVRDRDTTEQVRVPVADLDAVLARRLGF